MHPGAQVEDGGALAEEEQEHRADGEQSDYDRDTDQDRASLERDVGDRRQVVQPADALVRELAWRMKREDRYC